MSILINEKTSVLCQGITGKQGRFHTQHALEYGTQVVAGVTPGRGGSCELGVPVYDTVRLAQAEHQIDASVLYVPAAFAADAMIEAIYAGIRLIICITEGVPVLDMIKVNAVLKDSDSILVGPNCPGIITPDECKIGIMPGAIHRKGHVGIVSRSGTLTYVAVSQTTQCDLGQSTCVGIGGDPIHGLEFVDCLQLFQEDEETDGIVMVGEIGGIAEEVAAEFIQSEITKPVLAYVAGVAAPPGKQMGHAGAIISAGKGTADQKYQALEKAGVCTVRTPAEIGKQMKALLDRQIQCGAS